MKKRIYIVDYIGVHSGMDYYLEAFREVLTSVPEYEVEVLSNYPDKNTGRIFFRNQYRGSILNKGVSLLYNLMRFLQKIKTDPDAAYIYLSYGNEIDIPFMKIVSKLPNHIIDIHEGIAQNIDTKTGVLKKFKRLYGTHIKNVISHSSRTDDFLKSYGFAGRCFKVPHFKYIFSKDYNQANISSDIIQGIDSSRTNLLFFGNLNRSKGVDLLIEAFNSLPEHVADKYNLIVAGKDFDGSVWEVKPGPGRKVNIFVRHISDDELCFLYQNVDFLCLPYRKTSQSGILEMAFYFKKPIIATQLPYFEQTLKRFPSFGVLAGNGVNDYVKTLESVLRMTKADFFKDTEYADYENRREVAAFKNELKEWLSHNK